MLHVGMRAALRKLADIDGAQIRFGWTHTVFTKSPADWSSHDMDSSRWQVKKRMPETNPVDLLWFAAYPVTFLVSYNSLHVTM